MARGLTELDVHHAADDIVSLGERPTVERIRAHLGTGSPNTVTRWLETWWSSVGARLRQRAMEADRPDVPEAVLALAQRCWNAALEGAGEQAQRDLAATRAALADEAAQLAAGHELHAQGRQELQLAQAETAAAQTSIELLRTQLAEATAHTIELRTQRDGAYARAERLEQHLAELRDERDVLLQHHQAERKEMTAHFRSTEDRLNQEVDRARQEARGLSESMSKQATQSRTALQTLQDRVSTAVGERAEAIATAAAERARADQLQNQVESLAALVVSVERALQASQKTKAGQTRKRAALPARGAPTKSQDRPTKVRQR
jgi:chromosome segregation ATPase